MLIGGIEILPVSVFSFLFFVLKYIFYFRLSKAWDHVARNERIDSRNKPKDEKAWKVLFKSFYAPLCHYSSRILADEQVVPDIVQNTLVNLWK